LGLLGAVEQVGLGSVAGWGIVSRGVARWKAWGQATAVDVVFRLEVLNSDFRFTSLCCHLTFFRWLSVVTAPGDRTNSAVP